MAHQWRSIFALVILALISLVQYPSLFRKILENLQLSCFIVLVFDITTRSSTYIIVVILLPPIDSSKIFAVYMCMSVYIQQHFHHIFFVLHKKQNYYSKMYRIHDRIRFLFFQQRLKLHILLFCELCLLSVLSQNFSLDNQR